MARIFHHIANYSPPYDANHTAREAPIECSRTHLARCLVTVGNPSFLTWAAIRQFGFTRALYDSVISKFSLVLQNLRVDQGVICRHPIFDSYVSDQKRAVSYNLGMALSKFYAEAILDIPNLVHIEFLKKQNAVVLMPTTGKRRAREPDLVGSDPQGRWHLFEGKAVSGSEAQLEQKIADAKNQLAQVSAIHSHSPETRSACATYIGVDKIVSRLEDPEGDEQRSIEIPVEEYFDAYYKPFSVATLGSARELGLQVQEQRIDGIDAVGVELERGSTKFFFGLEAEMKSQIESRDFRLPPDLREKLNSLSQREDEHYSVGPDGYVVENRSRDG